MTHARNGESFLPDQHTEKLMRILEKDLERLWQLSQKWSSCAISTIELTSLELPQRGFRLNSIEFF